MAEKRNKFETSLGIELPADFNPTNSHFDYERNRLTQARNYYVKALDIFTDQETKKIIYYEDRENPHLAREKINFCNEKFNCKS
jgi:hypothetical protein